MRSPSRYSARRCWGWSHRPGTGRSWWPRPVIGRSSDNPSMLVRSPDMNAVISRDRIEVSWLGSCSSGLPNPETHNAFTYYQIEAALRRQIEVVLPYALSNHYHAVIFDRCSRYPQSLELQQQAPTHEPGSAGRGLRMLRGTLGAQEEVRRSVDRTLRRGHAAAGRHGPGRGRVVLILISCLFWEIRSFTLSDATSSTRRRPPPPTRDP